MTVEVVGRRVEKERMREKGEWEGERRLDKK